MSAMNYDLGRAAVGSVAAGVVLVAGVVIKELGHRAKAARASEEYLTDQLRAVETAERDVPIQRRAQALLDDDYPLEATREELRNRRSALLDHDSDDDWSEFLWRIASAAIGSGTTRQGLTQ